MDEKYILYAPGELYDSELEVIANQYCGEFDPEPESNITGEILCSLTFGLVNAVAAVAALILQHKSLTEEKFTLVTPDGIYRNITLEQAQKILGKEINGN